MMEDEETKEIRDLAEANDADGQEYGVLSWKILFFCSSIYVKTTLTFPLKWRRSVPMCGLYVMYIFESNIK